MPGEFAPDTEQILNTLSQAGALFFNEVVRQTGLLPSRVEQALGELAASGWVTADSFEGLRALLIPSEKRAPFAERDRKRRHRTVTSIEFAGRWSLLRTPGGQGSYVFSEGSTGEPTVPSSDPPDGTGRGTMETYARALLRRYGVAFRRLLER